MPASSASYGAAAVACTRRRRPAVGGASGGGTLRRLRADTTRCAAAGTEAAQLLDAFWLARGVVDEGQRRQLVAAAGSLKAELDSEAFQAAQVELPSLSAAWFLPDGDSSMGGSSSSSPELAAVSRRILALQQLLGGGGVDVVWMLVREPRLLSEDFRGRVVRPSRWLERLDSWLLRACRAGCAGGARSPAGRPCLSAASDLPPPPRLASPRPPPPASPPAASRSACLR